MILKFLAETVCEPGTAAHLHSRGQIKSLHITRADLLGTGNASYHVLLDSAHMTWGVTVRSLSALEMTPEYVVVAGSDRTKTGFPRDCVFCFDDALFARLQEAYENGSAKTLSELWTSAKPL